MSNDVKRGAGGIREVEFVAQTFQIIRGGRDARFQTPALKDVLLLLGSEEMLPAEDTAALYQSYTFLRNVEHALQGWQDKQTQMLPEGELDQHRLAYLMGFEGWSEFLLALNAHRALVRQLFEEVVADERRDEMAESVESEIQLAAQIWQDHTTEDILFPEFEALGYKNAEQAAGFVNTLKESRSVLAMATDTRGRLDGLMPALIAACALVDNAAEALGWVLKLVEAVARRSAYLVLLKENPVALQSMIKLCAASPWIAEQLCRYPALLDELLDSRTLYSLPNRDELEDELRQQLLRVPSDDLEAQMEVLRYFQRSHVHASCNSYFSNPTRDETNMPEFPDGLRRISTS